ncbi:MAG: hypothetical protein Q9221_000215 [Calogaya cf. arnoldii]
MNALYPAHSTPSGRKTGAERFQDMYRTDPNTTFLKVTDMDTGEMIAQAKWNIYNGTMPEEVELDGDYWVDAEEKDYARYLFRQYQGPRRIAIKKSGGHLVSLDILTVDPHYQRRGAGRMLLQWGTAVADRLGIEAVVEATGQGLGLYQSEGFQIEDHCTIALPDKWAGRKAQEFEWMVRPKKLEATA